MATLFCDFLTALGVRHTREYSDKRFYSMPFHTMFGLSKLLNEYGVATQGLKTDDPQAIATLQVPFLADTADGFALVTHIGADTVSYLSQGARESAPLSTFLGACNGIVLTAQPTAEACEPGYRKHRFVEVMNEVKVWALRLLVAAMIGVAFALTGIWHRWTSILIALLDIGGIYVSWMLVQKSLGIKNLQADAMCAVIEEGGCDTIAKSAASSFFGVFKWSEVGLAYFSVSLLALLLFPWQCGQWLALCNILALPYTIWSITYQKFVAKTWCTLCVTVQALLWALFIVYLCGGWLHGIFPLQWTFALLIAVYAIALLAINTFDRALARLFNTQTDSIDHDAEATD